MARAGGRLSPRGRAIEHLLLEARPGEVDALFSKQDREGLSIDEIDLLHSLVRFIRDGEKTTRRLQSFFDAVQRHIEDSSYLASASDADLLRLCAAAGAQAEHAVDIREIQRVAAGIDPASGVDPQAFAQGPLPGIFWAKDLYRELTRRGTPELIDARRIVEEMLTKNGVEPPEI
ncbi:MAG: hypothetical protein ACR2H3_17605 [Acidimicrobiales bacterium]